MTIKHHIILSATITVALIAIIACQQKTQAPKEQSKAVSEQKAKVEEVMNNFEQEAKAETEKLETKVEQVAREVKEEVKEIESKVEEAVAGPNLFANADFSQGLKDWEKTKGCAVIKEDGKNIVELTGQANEQVRLYQKFNAVAGHVYRLSFNVKYENGNAFGIFRDDVTSQEKYLHTGAKAAWKTYTKDFKAENNGDVRVFLSCQGDGKFYYADPKLIDLGPQE
ncbi:carbohydrate binding domain-containing protein [bacterium]|nr:carbohydrate binding domain-containing protein [bacterium]